MQGEGCGWEIGGAKLEAMNRGGRSERYIPVMRWNALFSS
jgi:hypothetical protein